MKYNIGDRVRVKSWNQLVNEFGTDKCGELIVPNGFPEEMKKYCGKVVAIINVLEEYKCYEIEEDKISFYWDECVFEDVNKTKTNLELLQSYSIEELVDFLVQLSERGLKKEDFVSWLKLESDGARLSNIETLIIDSNNKWKRVKDKIPILKMAIYKDRIVKISDPVKIIASIGNQYIGRYVFSMSDTKYLYPKLYWKICKDENLDKIDWENDMEIPVYEDDCWKEL